MKQFIFAAAITLCLTGPVLGQEQLQTQELADILKEFSELVLKHGDRCLDKVLKGDTTLQSEECTIYLKASKRFTNAAETNLALFRLVGTGDGVATNQLNKSLEAVLEQSTKLVTLVRIAEMRSFQ